VGTEATTYSQAALAVLGIVAVGCSIPVGTAADLRLVPSIRQDQLAGGFSAGGNIMGLNLGFAVGARCLGLVSSMQGNGRCVGVGLEKKNEDDAAPPTAMTIAPTNTAAPSDTAAPRWLAAAPPIEDGGVERGVSGGAKLFGLGLGVSMSGRCLGLTAERDGNGRCLGIGLRPGDDSRTSPAGDAGSAETTARKSSDGRPAQAR
jgi:hypothetical protein